MKRALLVAAVWLCGCGGWEIEPLPPEERGPRASVPGADAPASSGPGGPSAPAGSLVVSIEKVDCPVCADLLERRLGSVAGVRSVRVDRAAGRAVVTGEGVSAAALRREAEAGGFVVRGIGGG